MIPIYEQGSSKSIGHTLGTFFVRFNEICAEHLKQKRARSFAFIFYDFSDKDIRKILNDQCVFVKLDRLSGRKLSIFYLHASAIASVKKFNEHFLSALGIKENALPPCVVFFRVCNDTIKDVKVAQLENADLIHGFSEIFNAIEEYLSDKSVNSDSRARSSRWVNGAKFLMIEVFRAALRKILDDLL